MFRSVFARTFTIRNTLVFDRIHILRSFSTTPACYNMNTQEFRKAAYAAVDESEMIAFHVRSMGFKTYIALQSQTTMTLFRKDESFPPSNQVTSAKSSPQVRPRRVRNGMTFRKISRARLCLA